MPSTPGR